MTLVQITLTLATFLCSLVAGFLFAFAIVVMPGIGRLNDKAFLQAFQVIDGVIQRNQPLFILVWVGSAIALIATVAVGIEQFFGSNKLLLIVATAIYLLGVHLPTIIINIPMNSRLQKLELDAMNDTELQSARTAFEPRWNMWNHLRTVVSCIVTVMLMYLLIQL